MHCVTALIAAFVVSLAGTAYSAEETSSEKASDTEAADRVETEEEVQVDPVPRRISEAFYKAIAEGNDEDALFIAVPGRFEPEEFIEIREKLDLSKGEIETVYAGDDRACAMSSSIPARNGDDTATIGLRLVKVRDRWLVEDIECLLDLKAIVDFLGRFQKIAPDAVTIPKDED
jgi:hypothetical protein